MIVLVVCVAGALFASIGHSVFAQQATVTAQDWYIPSGQEPWGTAFDSSGHVWVAVTGCDPTPTCSNTTPPGKIEEFDPTTSSWLATYQLPANYAQPLFLAFNKIGRIWFAMPMNNSIGMFDPVKKVFKEWVVPTANAGPWDITIDHNGLIWFTEHYTDKIGSFSPSKHTFTEYTTPTANSLPYGIVVDAQNRIWFTENNPAVARIGELIQFNHLIKEYTIRANPPSGLTPHLLTVDPKNGNIWWTEGFVGMIAMLNLKLARPGTNKGVTEYSYTLPCSTCGSHTSAISVDSNGIVWFDDSVQNIFGSFPDTGTGSFTLYPAPTLNGHPHDGLRVDSQNRVWFTEEFANKLAEAQ